MGRKIEMKKIEDVTKCQVTFSKRRSSLMKKANELAVCCDVDVAFVAFSPSGRVSKFCNQKRIEDLLNRYVNLPAESRLMYHIDNVQRKVEKLKNLDHIKSETSKLQYLEKQTENLELQIKKSSLELQILEANLRDYELDPHQEPSLHLLSWCERNINHTLERVQARKSALLGHLQAPQNQDGVKVNENNTKLHGQSSVTTKIIDPWTTPFRYSAKFRESIPEDLPDQANLNPGESNVPISSNTQIPSFEIPQQNQKPLAVDHAELDYTKKNTVNFSSNAIYNSNHIRTMPTPRFTPTRITSSEVKMPEHDTTEEGNTQVNKTSTSHDQSETQAASGDNWTSSKTQKSNECEWEEFLVDENCNVGGLSK